MQKSKDFYVYLHRRATDGKVFYVGKGHGRRAFETKSGRNKHWKNVFEKHGRTIEFYANGLQEWYAFELEIQLISYYGKENLCNYSDGGESASGTNHVFSETHRLNLSLAGKGRKATEQAKINMSKGRDFIKKIVFCSNGMSFESKFEAARWLIKNGFKKALPCAILACCNGSRKTAYGFNWSFIEFDEKTKINKRFGGKGVVCSNGMLFDSIKDAELFIKKTIPTARQSNIVSCCKKRQKTAYGYKWEYA